MLILAFSDGRDTASWTRADQALALARSSDAVVDAVVAGELLPTSAARPTGIGGLLAATTPDERFLADLAAQTGGRVRNGEAGAGLAGAFRNALEQFRGRYEITYTATSKDPGWHAIDVRVPGRRGASVHARRGYQR
jgi:D-tyrosyl-tRNA(Tyr) deacylase